MEIIKNPDELKVLVKMVAAGMYESEQARYLSIHNQFNPDITLNKIEDFVYQICETYYDYRRNGGLVRKELPVDSEKMRKDWRMELEKSAIYDPATMVNLFRK